MPRGKCPNCDNPYDVMEKAIGRKARCNSCGHVFVVTANGATTNFDANSDQRDGPPRRRSLWLAVGLAGGAALATACIVWAVMLVSQRAPVPTTEQVESTTADEQSAAEETDTSQNLLSEAREAYSDGDFERAKTLFRQAAEANSDDTSAWTGLGEACLMLDEHGEAIEAFKRVLQTNPEDTRALMHLGEALLGNGQVDLAVAAWERAAQIAPHHADANMLLATAYIGLGAYDMAISPAERLAATNRSGLALMLLANAYVGAERWSDAESLYEEIIEADSEEASAHLGLARVYLQTERRGEALRHFRRANEIEESADALSGIGRILLLEGNSDEARTYLARSLTLEPAQDNVWFQLSAILFGSAEYQRSLEMIDAAITRKGREPKYHVHRALILSRLGRHRESLAALQQAERLDGDKRLVFTRMGNEYRALDRIDEAVNAYERSMAIEPSVVTCLRLASCYEDRSRYLDAVEMYRLVESLDADRRDKYRAWTAGAYRNESARLARMENWPGAERYAREAVKISPEKHRDHLADVLSVIALDLTQTEDWSGAERYAREAVKINPEKHRDDLVNVLSVIALDFVQRGMQRAALEYVAEIRRYDRHKAAELEDLIR